MTRDELEHAIRAACDVAGDTEIYVFGSQAILGQYPDAPSELRQSVEADVMPKNRREKADAIDGSLGEYSLFHDTFGFYVHGLSIEAAKLPDGWENRLVKVQNANTNSCIGWCIDGHDLAASKLAAFREKDRSFVRVLLSERLVDQELLVARIKGLPIEPTEQKRLADWTNRTCRELDMDG